MRIILGFLMVFAFLNAKLINAVVASVNGEAVTLYDIEEASREEKISKAEALDLLIDLKLQEAKTKELGLEVDEYELDERLEIIASRNNLDLKTMREIIESRGGDWQEYKEGARKSMLNEKLARKILADELIPINRDEIRQEYQQNSDRYKIPEEIVVLQYAAEDEKLLRSAVQNPMMRSQGVSVVTQSLLYKETNPRLYAILKETDVGSFTPIFPAGDKLVALMVREKKRAILEPFEMVEAQISENMRHAYEERAIRGYFQKERASAEIEILRSVE